MSEKPVHKRIEYIGYLEDGTEFDRNEPGETLDLVVGRYTMPEPIVDAIADMEEGDEKMVELPHEKAYGDYDPNGVLAVPRSYIANGSNLKKGQRIIWRSEERPAPVAVLVKECDESSVLLDFNHPLAGRDLRYWIRVDEVVA